MAASGLVDTCAILALLERKDHWHERRSDAFVRLRTPLATSVAVLTVVFHLIGDCPGAMANAWEFLNSGAVIVRPIDDVDLPTLEALMRRYADRPMDFADATLVRLAEREG